MKAPKNAAKVDQFAAFVMTPLYKNYCEQLNVEREEILFVGKKTKDPHCLSKLEGFDQASSFFQRCVDMAKASNQINEQVEEDDL